MYNHLRTFFITYEGSAWVAQRRLYTQFRWQTRIDAEWTLRQLQELEVVLSRRITVWEDKRYKLSYAFRLSHNDSLRLLEHLYSIPAEMPRHLKKKLKRANRPTKWDYWSSTEEEMLIATGGTACMLDKKEQNCKTRYHKLKPSDTCRKWTPEEDNMLLNWEIPPNRNWWACYKRCKKQGYYHEWLLKNDTEGAPNWIKQKVQKEKN